MKSSKKKQEDRRSIVLGYIKVILIFAITVFLVLLFRNWYLNRVNYQLSIPIIEETLTQEINSSEIYNYIRENESSIIYMGVVTDQDCRDFEMDFNDVIREKGLQNIITYLNLTDEDNVNDFFKDFNKFYNTSLKGYPAIVIFEDGEVKDVLTSDSKKIITKDDAKDFLEKNNIASID